MRGRVFKHDHRRYPRQHHHRREMKRGCGEAESGREREREREKASEAKRERERERERESEGGQRKAEFHQAQQPVRFALKRNHDGGTQYMPHVTRTCQV